MKTYVIHENPEWMPPLRRELERAGLPWEEIVVTDGCFDLGAAPPEGVFLNRMSPSSHIRGHMASVDFSREVLTWLESHGRRVINGSRAFAMEISKVHQLTALRAAGLPVPETIVVSGGADRHIEAAARLAAPFISKPNRGGSGTAVRRFNSHAEYATFVRSPQFAESIDHVTLLQQFIVATAPVITRVEIVGGEFQFAMNADASHGFDLCPADSCAEADEPAMACPALSDTSGRFWLREDVSEALIDRYVDFAHANEIDVVGIEFVEDLEGNAITYDVNGTTNYSQRLAHKHGVNGPAAIVDLLAEEMRRRGWGGTPLAASA